MTVHPESSHRDKEERIRAIAYAIWEEEGCPDDCAEDHWAQATALVEAEADYGAGPDWLKRKAGEAMSSPRLTGAKSGKKITADEVEKRMKAARAA